MRIWASAPDAGGHCPVTVREGRDWLTGFADGHPLGELPAESRHVYPDEPAITAEGLWFKYEKELPQDVRMAVILLAEAYAKQAITQKEGAKSSETFDDYAYTMDNDSDIAENLGLALMLDDYIIQPDNGKVTMKLRKL